MFFLLPNSTKKMKRLIFILLFINLINTVSGQILNNSLFKIYRAPFILGAATHLRFDLDGNYEMFVSEIYCSLCDREKLEETLNSKGTWLQEEDTIVLNSNKNKRIKLIVVSDSLLMPYFPLGYDFTNTEDSIAARIIDNAQKNKLQDFQLVYDTYPNGVARFIIDRNRNRSEYEIELDPNGMIKKVDYFWNHKKTKKIR